MAKSIYGAGTAPLAIAHRGGAGLAVENTLEAFGRSYALGIRYLETDVRVTADGACVAFHDAALRRVTGRRGMVRGATRRELAGFGVPTLDEVLVAYPDACFTVDVKEGSAVAPLARTLRATKAAHRVCVAGAWDGWLAGVRRGRPGAHDGTRLAHAGRDVRGRGEREPPRHDHLRIPHRRRCAIRR